jgi:voltage-dependent calcium channel L type alpha-1D
MDESNRLRLRVIWLVTSRLFDQFVLLLIFANTITLAIVDLRHVDANGDPESRGSLRNTVANYADITFTVLFAGECTLKIIAMGFIVERGAYLMDPWNWIDFLVVFIGIIATFPGIPSVSGMKALRVLRPLRFLNAVPGIKKLVTALLKSIPELLTVVAFMFFLFFLYGVIGVQLWSGVMHSRCRLSPYPLQLDPQLTLSDLPAYQDAILANYSDFQCMHSESDGVNGAIPLEDTSWSHDTSPWRTPRICFWPVAEEKTAQLCSLNDDYFRKCPTGQVRRTALIPT